MARYELDKEFWQISRSGTAVTVRSGKLGNKGRTTVKHHPTAAAAKLHHDELVIAKLRDGYLRVDGDDPAPPAVDTASDDRTEALVARIVEDPTDVEAWMVYGDLLQRQGDPRGELMALQHAAEARRAANPRARGPVQAAVGKHLAKHAPALLGPLASYVKDVRDPAAPPFFWRSGFIHRLVLASGGDDLGAITEAVLRHPSGRLLQELGVRSEGRDDVHAVLDVIRREPPRALQELDLFARADLGDLGDVWAAVPRLRRLALTARSFELGELRVPAVQRARFLGLALSPRCIHAIAAAAWPVLERLELRIGNRFGKVSAAFEDLRPLLVRTDMPALTHLKIRGSGFAGAICRALAGSPLAGQLVVLDLSHGVINPQDAKILGEHASRFKELRELWIPLTGLWGDAAKALAGVAKHVISDKRSPLDTLEYDLGVDDSDPADRYEDVEE